MGSGIAAHLANQGFQVTLLDLTPDSTRAALDRAKSLRPPHFFDPSIADKIRIGGIDENLAWVSEADWVCEAIIEKLDAKRALYEKIEPFVREDAIISTNTSGLEISSLAFGRSESFRRRFLGTHFFNPPRYLKLLELIPTDVTDPAEVQRVKAFLEQHVARRVVVAKDTPGFIANRFGMWAMFQATHVAEKLQLSVEAVDAITGPFLGRPRTGSFRLNDLVGLDIMVDIAQNQIQRCPGDPHRAALETPVSIQALTELGYLGNKKGAGFYKREGKEFFAFDLIGHGYRPSQDPALPTLQELGKKPLGERIREALSRTDEVGDYLKHYLIPTLQYADYLKAEVSHNVEDFDRVMKWGFGWEMGPFEMIDAIGADVLGIEGGAFYDGAQMRAHKGGWEPRSVEPQFRGITEYPLLEACDGFNVRELDGGVKAICLTTKMGTINPAICRSLSTWLASASGPLVLTSEARHFSLGYDLNVFVESIEAENWEKIDVDLTLLQDLCGLLRERQVVAAVYGYVLGAGLEITMGCPVVLAHPESLIGLPEIKVGLLPGGSGTVELRARAKTVKEVAAHAKLIFTGATSVNAWQARSWGYLRSTDQIASHPDRLIADAADLALTISAGAMTPWANPEGPLTGMVDQLLKDLSSSPDWAPYDAVVAENVKMVMTKPQNFVKALEREREEFIELCKKDLTLQRIKHMVATSKPLRN